MRTSQLSMTRARLWTSRAVAGAAVLFPVFDGGVKPAAISAVVNAFTKLVRIVALAPGVGELSRSASHWVTVLTR